HANLLHGNTQERLQGLHQVGRLETPAFEKLHQATLLYRSTDHAIRLVTGKAQPELPAAEHPRMATEKIVSRTLETEYRDLQAQLHDTQEEVRSIFINLLNQ
ncbi:MAG TPA: hypothetical protein VJW55_12560, partial [Candidatus Angelobacter sp.]|nr:hypothetical protein [Candidatus Angelobacter sp.]